MNRRIDYGKKTNTCEPSWTPAGSANHESISPHSLLPVPKKAKRSLRLTILIYLPMMSYPPAAPRSLADHHLQTSWKPILEKGRLVDPTSLPVSRSVGRGENLAETNNRPCHLTNMYPTELRATPGHYKPCTNLSGLPPRHKQFLPPPFGDHRTGIPLLLVSISWTTIPPIAFSIPPFAMYDGSSDPYDHVLHYNQAMILNAGDDRLLCKVFPTSLKGPALAWFHKLPRGSINTFDELWAASVSQYLCSIRQKGNISSLQSILKREDESIRDFTRRFGQAVQ